MKRFFKTIYESLVRPKQTGSIHERDPAARGILIFNHTSEVIRAESLLKAASFDVQVKGPPPEVRTGCDMAVEFPLISQLRVVHLLKEAGIEPLDALPLTDLLL